jgi:hypothetical protein
MWWLLVPLVCLVAFVYLKPKPKVAIVSVCNDGYIDIARNCLSSLEKMGHLGSVHLYCVGDFCVREFKEKVTCYPVLSSLTERQQFRQGTWSTFMMLKMTAIHEHLLTHKFVCMVDLDIVFLKGDWLEYLLEEVGDVEMLIQNDTCQDECDDQLCSGFLFLRSTRNTRKLFDPCSLQRWTTYDDDQTYVNSIKDKLKYKRLPLEMFPNGRYFYQFQPKGAKLVHFNWTRDKQRTMELMKMWSPEWTT